MEKQEIIDLITNTLVKDPQIVTFYRDVQLNWLSNPQSKDFKHVFEPGVDVKLVVTAVIESLEIIIKAQSGKGLING